MWVPNKKLIFPQRRFAHPSMSLLGEDSMMMGAAGAVSGYVADAVVFDGTDHALRGADLSNNADTKEGTISFWVKFNGGDGVGQVFLANDGSYFEVRRNSSFNTDNIDIVVNDISAIVTRIISTSPVDVAAGWTHVAAAWNNATDTQQLYKDGISDIDAANSSSIDNDALYLRTEWSVGANTGGTSDIDADLFDFWFDNVFYDLSTNISSFISGGKPVDLGSDGSNVGVQPLIFCHLDNGETPANNFYTNAGDGGGFTKVGDLAVAASSPTD